MAGSRGQLPSPPCCHANAHAIRHLEGVLDQTILPLFFHNKRCSFTFCNIRLCSMLEKVFFWLAKRNQYEANHMLLKDYTCIWYTGKCSTVCSSVPKIVFHTYHQRPDITVGRTLEKYHQHAALANTWTVALCHDCYACTQVASSHVARGLHFMGLDSMLVGTHAVSPGLNVPKYCYEMKSANRILSDFLVEPWYGQSFNPVADMPHSQAPQVTLNTLMSLVAGTP